MKKYRVKEIVEAKQWNDVSDTLDIDIELYSGLNKSQKCIMCSHILGKHGKMLLPDHSYDLICPSDWLIKYSNGKIYSCDNETFLKMYEEVEN